jgi:hypothetical protein
MPPGPGQRRSPSSPAGPTAPSVSRASTRRSKTETRALIIETGVRLLLANGLQGGCDHVGMADVLAEVERTSGARITNASVYGRIWANQSEFHRDLLHAAAEYYPNGEEQATLDCARSILAAADLSTPTSRADTLRTICRDAGAAHVAALAASRAWQTWLAIWAITVSTPTLSDDLERGPAIAKRHEHAVKDFAAVLAEILPILRYRVKEGIDLHQTSTAIYALSEGLALHDRFAPESVLTVALPTADVGEQERWTLFSVGVHALLAHFVEPY